MKTAKLCAMYPITFRKLAQIQAWLDNPATDFDGLCRQEAHTWAMRETIEAMAVEDLDEGFYDDDPETKALIVGAALLRKAIQEARDGSQN